MKWGHLIISAVLFDAQVVHQRVFNTIKLYAKQRHLISLVTDQIQEKEKHNRMMVSILSQIVEFRMEKAAAMYYISIRSRACCWNV